MELYQGSTMRPKTLAFASDLCKIRVKIMYWSPDGEFIYPEIFCSLSDCIFQFKFQLQLSGLLNRSIDSDIKI